MLNVLRETVAMAINGSRNKPFGPGGGTRRLHQAGLQQILASLENGDARSQRTRLMGAK